MSDDPAERYDVVIVGAGYCMAFTVADSRIIGVREYIGDPMHTFQALSL